MKVAEDLTVDDYDKVPISNFGMNLMKMMGFSQEKGLGKSNSKAPAQVVVLKPRPKNLGLGADPTGSKQEEADFDNIYKAGNRIKIVNGPHKQLTGIILQSSLQSDMLIVQLQLSEQNVKVAKKEVEKIELFEELNETQEKKKKKRLRWVLPGITVKIVDKKSPYYLQKVKVVEITGDRSFECLADDRKILKDLRQKDIQTVIPPSDSLVIIVRGEHRGTRAKVKQRWKEEHEVMVQTVEELEIIKLPQDDVCAYED